MATVVTGVITEGPRIPSTKKPWHRINSLTNEYILYYSIFRDLSHPYIKNARNI